MTCFLDSLLTLICKNVDVAKRFYIAEHCVFSGCDIIRNAPVVKRFLSCKTLCK